MLNYVKGKIEVYKMQNIKIEETTKQVEKKLVALEMSRDMWKQLRLLSVSYDLSFSAMVRLIIGKYLRETDAKLSSEEKEEIKDE
jgi:hypothetical protein